MNGEPIIVQSRRPTPARDAAARDYPLGHSAGELARLERQSAFLGDLTENALRRAAIGPGMRILDIGCGVGDVALMAGALVGPEGAVLGIDRSVEAVTRARERAAAAGQSQVRFALADIETFTTIQTFDAVVGRLVLMYLPEPAATLRRLCEHLRPGGIVMAQEMAMTLARSVPSAPLFSRSRQWILDTFARAGIEYDMGSKLPAAFAAAGLPVPQMICVGRVEAGRDSVVYDYMADAIRSLLPAMTQLGVADAAEVAVDSLAARLREEALARNACIMPPPLIAAWARTPLSG